MSLASHFPLLQKARKPFAYLDNAATTQKPNSVLAAVDTFYRESNSNVHRGVYTLSEVATSAYEGARKTLARFLNAQAKEIIFTSGATASLNELALSLEAEFKPGDAILLSELEHHSNLLPWLRLAERRNAKVLWLSAGADGRLNLEEARAALKTERVKLVALSSVSHVLGNRQPVEHLFREAKSMGAITVLDATQGVARSKTDVTALNCDALAFSGHKLYAPTGVGVLYASEALQARMTPAFVGGGMVDRLTKDGAQSWRPAPWKFEAGTPPIEAAIGLGAAIDFIEEKSVFAHATKEKALIETFARHLASQPGVQLLGWASAEGPSYPPHEGLLSFTLEGLHPHDLAQTLADEGVAVRAGHHCAQLLTTKFAPDGCVRISLAAYNEETDFELFKSAFEKCLELRSELANV